MSETPPGSPPALDAETLAEFLDGRLDPNARARVIARLATDEDAYALFLFAADARRAMLDAGDVQDAPPPVMPASRTRTPMAPAAPAGGGTGAAVGRWPVGRVAAAALVILAVGAAMVVKRIAAPIDDVPTVLVASLDVGAGAAAGTTPAWRTTRTEGAAHGIRASAVRVGAHLAAHAFAVRTGDAAAASAAALATAELAGELPGGAPTAALYREMARLEPGDRAAERLRREGWRALQERLPEPELLLGAWAATARLSLLAGDVDWLAGDESLEVAGRIDAAALAPDTRAAWIEARRVLFSGSAVHPDARLDALEALIRAAAG